MVLFAVCEISLEIVISSSISSVPPFSSISPDIVPPAPVICRIPPVSTLIVPVSGPPVPSQVTVLPDLMMTSLLASPHTELPEYVEALNMEPLLPLSQGLITRLKSVVELLVPSLTFTVTVAFPEVALAALTIVRVRLASVPDILIFAGGNSASSVVVALEVTVVMVLSTSTIVKGTLIVPFVYWVAMSATVGASLIAEMVTVKVVEAVVVPSLTVTVMVTDPL